MEFVTSFKIAHNRPKLLNKIDLEHQDKQINKQVDKIINKQIVEEDKFNNNKDELNMLLIQ